MVYELMACLYGALGCSRSAPWWRVWLIGRVADGEAVQGTVEHVGLIYYPLRMVHGWREAPALGLLFGRGLEWALDPWTRMSSDLDTGRVSNEQEW